MLHLLLPRFWRLEHWKTGSMLTIKGSSQDVGVVFENILGKGTSYLMTVKVCVMIFKQDFFNNV